MSQHVQRYALVPADQHPGEQGSKPVEQVRTSVAESRRQTRHPGEQGSKLATGSRRRRRLECRQTDIQENKDRNHCTTVRTAAGRSAGRRHPGEQGSKPIAREPASSGVEPADRHPGEQGSKPFVRPDSFSDSPPADRHPGEQGSKHYLHSCADNRYEDRQTSIQENKDRNHSARSAAALALAIRQTDIQENKDRNSQTAALSPGRGRLPADQTSRRTRIETTLGVARHVGVFAAAADQHPGEQGSKPDAEYLVERSRLQGRRPASRRTRIETQRSSPADADAAAVARPASRRTRIETRDDRIASCQRADRRSQHPGEQGSKRFATALASCDRPSRGPASRRTRIETRRLDEHARTTCRPSRQHPGEQGSKLHCHGRHQLAAPCRRASIQENKDRNPHAAGAMRQCGRVSRTRIQENKDRNIDQRLASTRSVDVADQHPGEQGSKP